MSGAPVARRQHNVLVGLAVLIGLLVIGLLMAQIFTGCWVEFGGEMVDQPSVRYVEPPRLAAPAAAVPFQGPDVVAGEGAPANPVPFSAVSEQRGRQGYEVLCTLCHGDPDGDPGAVGRLFEPPPPRLADRVSQLPDSQVYLVITQGFGRMPALASQSDRLRRWDIVNYLRGITTGPAEPSTASEVARGAGIFAAQCASCHGAEGEGALGPPLYPSALLAEGTGDEIAAFLALGRPGRGMPAFSGRLDETQRGAVAVLLKAVQEEGPGVIERALEELGTTTTLPPTTTTTSPEGTTTTAPSAGTTTTTAGGPDQATLDQAAAVYAGNCEGCHGAEGAGGLGPRLKPNPFVTGSDDAAVREVIDQGRPGTAMPAWSGRISPEDIDKLVVLLRSWQGAQPAGMSAAWAEETSLPFSHRTHVERGEVPCLFCHASAARGPAADLPPLDLCAGCHRYLTTQTDATAAVVAAADGGRAVSWPRVYDSPDFVFFSHQPHIAADVECTECHGAVAGMDLVRATVRHGMGFCLDCHERQADATALIDCDVCHR